MQTSQQYCHSGSAENYFSSPKMPVKDHLVGLKKTQTSFKPACSIIDKETAKILVNHSGANCQVSAQHIDNLIKIKEMNLTNKKELYIVHHKTGKENGNIGSHHDKHTNPGYSRNKLGGFFTS